MQIMKGNSKSFAIDPKSTALLVIDMQEAFLGPGPFELAEAKKTIGPMRELIVKCRELGILIVYTRVYHDDISKTTYPMLFPAHFNDKGKPYLTKKSHIFQVISELKPGNNDIVIDKSRYSAFYKTNLESTLSKRGIRTVIVVGLATNVCCESTVRDAFFRNFRAIVVSDLCTTYDHDVQEASLDNIRNCFGFVVSYTRLKKVLA
jgi:nicotinamidase-related amidase